MTVFVYKPCKSIDMKEVTNLLLCHKETVLDKKTQRINHKNCVDCRYSDRFLRTLIFSSHCQLYL